MTLHLRITKAPDGAPLSQSHHTFDERGGSLGRGPENSWVLPDPERILSSRHCEFLYEAGGFQLLDLSTNGTFINNSPEPLGKGTAAPITNGDVIEVGDYQFAIELEEAGAAADPLFDSSESLSPFADEPAGRASPTPTPVSDDPFASDPFCGGDSLSLDSGNKVVDPLQALDGARYTDDAPGTSSPWGAEFDRPVENEATPFAQPDPWADAPSSSALVDTGPAGDAIAWPESRPENLIPDDWLEDDPGAKPPQAPEPFKPKASRPAPAPSPVELHEEPHKKSHKKPREEFLEGSFGESVGASLESDEHSPFAMDTMPPEPARPAAVRPKPGATRRQPAVERVKKPATAAAAAHEDALFTAMGLDAKRLSEEERAELYPLMGKLMREVIDGLMQVLRSRASIKNEFRMNVTTIQPVENNPLKFSADVDEALDNIFVRRSQAYKEPLAAVREGFQEIAEHQLAMIAGMRSAFEHMLQDFDPEKLRPRFDKQQKPNPIAPLQQGRYWRQYRDYYQSLSDNIERSFQQVFGDEFVQAYQEQLRRLSAARKP